MRKDKDPRRKRDSFNTIATLYDRYRQGYPAEVVADVIRSAHLDAGSRVLEIGCGTGQLSCPLAEHGVLLVAVELGPDLARIARHNLDRFPNASVKVAAFEDWPLPSQAFDAVVCANAFHWLDPDIRFAKAAKALRTGGALVIVHPHHVKGDNPGWFSDTNKYYMKWGLSDDPSFEPPAAADTPAVYPELEQRADFTCVCRHRFGKRRRFTTQTYVGMLGTDSLILGLEDSSRQGFLEDIARLIDSRYDGEVTWDSLYEVVIAYKAPTSD